MFNRAIESKLRSCDVAALKVEDIAPSGAPLMSNGTVEKDWPTR
jgi:hypothetical protein